MQLPIAVGVFRGKDYIIELVNEKTLELWRKTREEVMHQPLFDVFPELLNQGFGEILYRVYHDGERFTASEQPFEIICHGEKETLYVSFSNTPLRNEKGGVEGFVCVLENVTELVNARKKIEEKNEELQFVTDTIPQLAWIADAEGKVVYFNKNWLAYTGSTLEEIGGDGWKKVLHPDDVERTECGWEQAVGMGESIEVEYRLKRYDGVYRWFLARGTPMKDDQGNVVKWYGTTTDINERKELEDVLEKKVSERTADLEQQQMLISSILDASINAVVALDAVKDDSGKITDFRLVKINRVFKAFTGLDESVLGASYLAYFPYSAENGIMDMYLHVMATGVPVRKEIYSKNQDMNSWFDISVVKRDENGIVVTFANVSPQREAARRIEEQKNLLDNILKYSPSGIIVYEAIRDAQGKVEDFKCIIANEAVEKFTGTPTEERYKKTLLELNPNLRGSPVIQKSIAVLEEGNPFQMEYYNELVQKWMGMSVVKMYNDRLINVFWDMTPVKEAQVQLEKTVEDLKFSNANLQDFAYAASHDMKEPIRKVHTFADRLKTSLGSQLNDEQKRYFERMQVAAKRMKSLIDDLLYFTEVSRSPLSLEDVDLNHVIEQVLHDLDLEIEEKGAVISVDKLFVLKGHHRQLQQVFHNLVGNALKYTKPGVKPEIKISCHKITGKESGLRLSLQEQQQEFYLIEVSDNGIGFKQKDSDRIFHVFQRLHENTEHRGTGLGLAIVKRAVENHYGHVAAEGKPGVGSTFKVLLPAH